MRTPFYGIPIIVFVFIGPPAIIGIANGNSASEKILLFTATLAGVLFACEIIFRFVHRLLLGRPYTLLTSIPFDSLYIEPHPYIPFIYKRFFPSQKAVTAPYPLHKGKFKFGQYTSNNLGFNNGPAGNRDIKIPKPSDLFRVCCIGASTTASYIEKDGEIHSYPIELEKILKPVMKLPVEVNNCAQGGYNSADILVRFALQVIDTTPDVLVIYHAYNDIRPYLTPNFSSDYSHCRKNLGENYWKYAISGKIPNIPIKFVNFLINLYIPTNIRYSLLDQVSKGSLDPNASPDAGLATYRRNIQHIINICHANGTKVVLSTYCHFMYEEIKDDPLHCLYGEIVARENNIMRDLALKNGTVLVDNAILVPQDECYFVDSVHFTPEGMALIAHNISEAIQTLTKR